MMRAILFDTYGGPEVLRIGDVALPEPAADQVKIKVAAIGINPADGKWRSGMFKARTQLLMPHIPGYDVAGVVAAVGQDVKRFRPGDRLVASMKKGAYAEYAVAEEDDCARIPDNMPFWQAAALPCAALTGMQMVEEGIVPAKGDTVLVTGATGAVGRFALHAALSAGAKVIAAVRPGYFDEALRLGACSAIALGKPAPDGMVFDSVADTVGGDMVGVLCRSVRPDGKIVTVSTTPIDPVGLPVSPRFFGYHTNDIRLSRIAADVASGAIAMPVAHRLPLAKAAEGQRLVDQGGVGGKVILEP